MRGGASNVSRARRFERRLLLRRQRPRLLRLQRRLLLRLQRPRLRPRLLLPCHTTHITLTPTNHQSMPPCKWWLLSQVQSGSSWRHGQAAAARRVATAWRAVAAGLAWMDGWRGLAWTAAAAAGLDFFFYLLLFFCRVSENAHGNFFAVCPTKGTRQMTSLPTVVYRVCFVVCYTRQTFCCEFFGLCRVLLAHGKLDDSGSEYVPTQILSSRLKKYCLFVAIYDVAFW